MLRTDRYALVLHLLKRCVTLLRGKNTKRGSAGQIMLAVTSGKTKRLIRKVSLITSVRN